MKTRDIIIDELNNVDKIQMKDLADRIGKKLDTTSHQVRNLAQEGIVKISKVRIGRSFNTFVWLSDKNNIQLEKDKIQLEKEDIGNCRRPGTDMLDRHKFLDPNQKIFQVESYKNRRILENSNIQLEKLQNPFDFRDNNADLKNTKGRLKLPLEILRSYYYYLTFDKKKGKGKTHRGKKNDLIDKLHELLEAQREGLIDDIKH